MSVFRGLGLALSLIVAPLSLAYADDSPKTQATEAWIGEFFLHQAPAIMQLLQVKTDEAGSKKWSGDQIQFFLDQTRFAAPILTPNLVPLLNDDRLNQVATTINSLELKWDKDLSHVDVITEDHEGNFLRHQFTVPQEVKKAMVQISPACRQLLGLLGRFQDHPLFHESLRLLQTQEIKVQQIMEHVDGGFRQFLYLMNLLGEESQGKIELNQQQVKDLIDGMAATQEEPELFQFDFLDQIEKIRLTRKNGEVVVRIDTLGNQDMYIRPHDFMDFVPRNIQNALQDEMITSRDPKIFISDGAEFSMERVTTTGQWRELQETVEGSSFFKVAGMNAENFTPKGVSLDLEGQFDRRIQSRMSSYQRRSDRPLEPLLMRVKKVGFEAKLPFMSDRRRPKFRAAILPDFGLEGNRSPAVAEIKEKFWFGILGSLRVKTSTGTQRSRRSRVRP